MKKVAYIAGGILIGVVLSTAGGAFADQVKSLVGKKVTGEYTVIVDGKKLSDKGAVIDNKANVPARSLSEALGADVKVSGKTITISTESSETVSPSVANATTNKYKDMSKSTLEGNLKILKENILEPTNKAVKEIEDSIQKLKDADKEYREYLEKQIGIYTLSIQQSKESGDNQIAAEREAQLKEVEDLLSNKQPYNQDSISERENELKKLKETIDKTNTDIKLIEEALASK